ncbi:MAG TPA: twin transmembrane helix small protein [Rhodanobacter sp.]
METVYKFALVAVLLVVIFSLGQALYFMMIDKDDDRRTVWALTRRIGLSLLFFAMVAFGIWIGWLQPHDVGQ